MVMSQGISHAEKKKAGKRKSKKEETYMHPKHGTLDIPRPHTQPISLS
jgi:hypothetical protein